MGLQIRVINARTSGDISEAFETFVRERPDALFVVGDAFFNSRRVQLANLASRHAIPATYPGRDFPEAGGKAMFQMMGVFAEFERAMIAERVRAGLARGW